MEVRKVGQQETEGIQLGVVPKEAVFSKVHQTLNKYSSNSRSKTIERANQAHLSLRDHQAVTNQTIVVIMGVQGL